MQLDRIRDAMRAQPFRAFDIKLANGESYAITHSDWVAIPPVDHPREVMFYSVTDRKAGDYRVHWINLGLVMEVSVPSMAPLPAAGPRAEGNGA
jgi:hypothetical protein